jgi:hypothetical protein
MKAQVGDELIIVSAESGKPDRTGTIMALQNTDGSPPYVVHWVVGDCTSLIEPGSQARIERRAATAEHRASLETAVTASVDGRGIRSAAH